ncbi:MAG: hypothetical protein H6727_07315 [Myxococcales bacterium]|nr:hypothetical protein [Myxococcales bacterium]
MNVETSSETPIERLGWRASVGVGLFSCAVLLYELCLTRVLSVVFYYHTAFLALSLAMLGLGAGAVWVYLQDARSPVLAGAEGHHSVRRWLLLAAWGMAFVPILLGWLRFDSAMLESPFQKKFILIFFLVSFFALLPFVCCGVVLSRWFVLFRRDVPKLYGWDLAGAALGALLLVPWMGWLGGPLALFSCAALMVFVNWWMFREQAGTLGRWIATLGIGGLLVLQVTRDQWSIQVDFSPDAKKKEVLYKRWNAFSRVALLPSQDWDRAISNAQREFWKGKLPEQREALIDINAYAPFVAFDGDLKKLRYLGELVSNAAYHLLSQGKKVVVLGPGGGKDILGALLFQPSQVTGIELNPILVRDLLSNKMRKFSGNLIDHPKVRWIVGEGRSELQRLNEKFDVIVANSVVTWAAHSSGGMNLAEHSLYTEEACGLYFDRLTKQGILSVSLWDIGNHALILRWIRTCEKAAKKRGIASLATHTIVLSNPWSANAMFTTVLISRQPFSRLQILAALAFSRSYSFVVSYIPPKKLGFLGDSVTPAKPASRPASLAASRAASLAVSSPIAMTAEQKEQMKKQMEWAKRERALQSLYEGYFQKGDETVKRFPAMIEAATDDRPFFLYTARIQDLFGADKSRWMGENAAIVSLALSLFVVCLLLLAMLLGPLWWSSRHQIRTLPWGALAFFLCLGLGFMFVEVPVLQRLTLFLGHPTYALTVGLSSLLLWSGLGSMWVGQWQDPTQLLRVMRRFWWVLLLVLLAVGFGLNPLLQAAMGWPFVARMSLAFVLLAICGFGLGMPLPAGMSLLAAKIPHAVPWAWGLNGAAGVVASVGIVWVAAELGFSWAFAMAWGCYLLAAFLFWRMAKALID